MKRSDSYYSKLESASLKDLEEMLSATTLFRLDPETERDVYKTEKRRLIETMFLYGNDVLNRNARLQGYPDEDYTMELFGLAKRCIASFNPESGGFLPYYLKSLNVEKRRLLAKRAKEAANRIPFPMDETEQELLFGKMLSSGESVQDYVERKYTILDRLNDVNHAYLASRKNSQPLLSAMLTNHLFSSHSNQELAELACGYDFFNKEVAAMVFDRKKEFEQKEIASAFHKSPANINQIYKRFLKKVQQGGKPEEGFIV